MKNNTGIFANIIRVTSLVAVLCVVPMAGFGALNSNGCDDENNEYVNPELALCSTHVYNIGLIENPKNEAERQIMRDVVALKTTVITQQMYSQYEILKNTVERLKTQLQKEVLLAQLKVASGDTGTTSGGASYGGGASGGGDKYVVLQNAENCLQVSGGNTEGINCLIRNANKIVDAVSAGNIGDAKRQLISDLNVADIYGVKIMVPNPNDPTKMEQRSLSDAVSECKNVKQNGSSKRDDVRNCAYKLKVSLNTKLEEQQNKNSQRQNPGGGF